MPLARGRCQCWLCRGESNSPGKSGLEAPCPGSPRLLPLSAELFPSRKTSVRAAPRKGGCNQPASAKRRDVSVSPPSPLPPAPRDRDPAGRIRPLLPPGRDGPRKSRTEGLERAHRRHSLTSARSHRLTPPPRAAPHGRGAQPPRLRRR